jgi:hypothetical protein
VKDPPIETDLRPIRSFEPITADRVKAIARSLGPIGCMILKLGDVDPSAGAGVVDDSTKCLWTKAGHRIEFNIGHGGFIGSVTRGVDPSKPAKKA